MISIQLQASTTNDFGENVTAHIAEALQKLGMECSQLFTKRVYPEIFAMLEAESKAQFGAQGQGRSGAWEPLTDGYAAWKAKAYPGQPINQRTGHLFDGLTNSASPYALRSGFVDLEFGVIGIPYADFIQGGTVNMVARPVIDLDETFEQRIADVTEAALIGAARDSGADNYFNISSERTAAWGVP